MIKELQLSPIGKLPAANLSRQHWSIAIDIIKISLPDILINYLICFGIVFSLLTAVRVILALYKLYKILTITVYKTYFNTT